MIQMGLNPASPAFLLSDLELLRHCLSDPRVSQPHMVTVQVSHTGCDEAEMEHCVGNAARTPGMRNAVCHLYGVFVSCPTL